MVREMNIFADSGTAGIDLSSLQTNYQGFLGAVIMASLPIDASTYKFTLHFNLDMPVLSIILCSRGTARSTRTADFLMFFLLLYACRPNRMRVTADMLIITEIPGLCTTKAISTQVS